MDAAGSLVLISGGDGASPATQVRTYLRALSRAEIVYGRRRAGGEVAWKLACDLGPQATHPQTLCRCPVRPQHGAGAAPWEQQQKTHWIRRINMLSRRIDSLVHVLGRRMEEEDGQIRILEKEG